MTLVDTSVLLDVLVQGAAHGDESERRLARAVHRGRGVVNEIIACELAPAFFSADDLWSTLTEAGVALGPYPRTAVYPAHSCVIAVAAERGAGFCRTS